LGNGVAALIGQSKEKPMVRIVPLVLLLAAALPAIAQAPHAGHGAAPPDRTTAPSTQAFREANERMHRDMGIAFTGDADRDFARGMIAHHQGAIDMAKVVLQYGTDPSIAALAREIIGTQEREIATFLAWLAVHGD